MQEQKQEQMIAMELFAGVVSLAMVMVRIYRYCDKTSTDVKND